MTTRSTTMPALGEAAPDRDSSVSDGLRGTIVP